MKFSGSLDDLKRLLANAGLRGQWSEANGAHTFRGDDRGVMNWWPSKGTVTFQGPERSKKTLEDTLRASLDQNPSTTTHIAPSPQTSAKRSGARVFVVHGHDVTAREQLERILLLLKLDPFVLQNSGGGGMTIIEALEKHAGKDTQSEFGIVLMTPDDMGYAKRDGDVKVQPRARQNVVLEMGMLLTSLGRSHVAILVKGHVDLPSDAQGVIYLHFNDHVKETVPLLTQRLRDAGFSLDPDAVSKAGA